MARALFISAEYVKAFSGVSASVDNELIKPVIETAQFMYILPVLGGGLYDKLVNDVTAGTVTGNYQTLLNVLIAPVLVQWTLREGYADWQYRIMGAHIGTRQSDNSEPAVNVAQLQSIAEERAKKYTIRLIDYICRNADQFPEYGTEGAISGMIVPTTQAQYMTGGMEIGTRNKQRELKRWQYDKKR
jgi:hypothetical protein